MPIFKNTVDQRKWVKHEKGTAKFVRVFWKTSSEKQKRDPEFLCFLVKCGWCNTFHEQYSDATREWRNNILAKYLGIEYDNINKLAKNVNKFWPRIDEKKAKKLLESYTGITNYYKAFRPRVEKFIKKYSEQTKLIFDTVSSKSMDSSLKIRKVFQIIDKIPMIKTPTGGKTSLVNALSPTLMCLDPHLKFPIMNMRTQKLLHCIDKDQNAEGAMALAGLIGGYGIKNSFQLDVYSQTVRFPKYKRSARVSVKRPQMRNIGLKSEYESYAIIHKQRKRIKKLHNKLINKFQKHLLWRQKIQESKFDALLPNWRPGRNLLIEAKTSSSGTSGRHQIREAIGQLFDYRKTFFPEEVNKVDLTILLPTKPSQEIMELLKSIKIHLLWFQKDELKGTIRI